MASEEVADLVRKAWKSIIADPVSWDQGFWIEHDEGGCGTTFCLGGWMMVHKGFKHQIDPYATFVDDHGREIDVDSYVRPWIIDIHGAEHTGPSIFSSEHDTLPKLKSAIEAAGIVLDEPEPEHPADWSDWDLQFHQDIDFFVEQCVKAGDRITARQVRSDDILMGLLRTIRRNGRREGKAEVPANAGVLEAQHLLKIEQRHSEKLRQDLDREKAMTSEYIRQRDDALKALREENEDLKLKNASAPSTRVDALQRALRERTKQAREAGAAAREARIQGQVKDEAIDRLTALLERQGVNMAAQAQLEEAQRKIDLLHVRMRRIHDLSNPGGN